MDRKVCSAAFLELHRMPSRPLWALSGLQIYLSFVDAVFVRHQFRSSLAGHQQPMPGKQETELQIRVP